MNLDQIKTFRLAAELGSFSRAADERFLSQPAVSQQIRQLERDLGVTLFERNGKGITLTPAGATFLDYAHRMDTMEHELRARVDSLKSNTQTVSLGCASSSAHYVVPHLLMELRQVAPDMQVRVTIAAPDQAMAMLIKGEIDCILTTHDSAPSHIVCEPCLVSRMFVVAPAGHVLTRASRVSAMELAPYPFALLAPHWVAPHLFRRWAAEQGVEIQVVMETDGFDGLKEAVREGIGLSLIGERAIAEDLREGKLGLVRVIGMPLELPVYFAHRSSAARSDVLACFRRVALGGDWRHHLPHIAA